MQEEKQKRCGYRPQTAAAVRANRLRRERARRRRQVRRWTAFFGILAVFAAVAGGLARCARQPRVDLTKIQSPDWIEQAFLDPGGDARTGETIPVVRDIAIHYVGNPGTSAMGNRSYFNQPGVEVCSHFIVGLDGEVVQCLPLCEKSAATNQRNIDTISIEVCHPDETGKFNEKTYAALVKLAAWLCSELQLDEENLIRHYDVTGKLCPLYYVEHEDAWEQLKRDVGEQLAAGGQQAGA